MKYIRVLLLMISFIMVFTSIFCVAAEHKIDKNIDETINSPRYSIPMSIAIGFNFNNSDPYESTSMVDISADPSDVEYFILRVVLERYNGSGYTVVKTWRDVKITVDDTGDAFFSRHYKHTESGSYRIRVSGEGYKNSRCVVTFSNKISKIASC